MSREFDGTAIPKGIDLLLKETLRHLHATAVLNGHKQPGDLVFARLLELATLVGLKPETIVLYPDPPVGVGEARRLQKANVTITTPFQRLAAERSLKDQAIALSMSENTDIETCGWIRCTLRALCSTSRDIY